MSLIYSPGPAAYDLGTGIGKATAVSMKGRPKTPDTSSQPGPGAYKLEGHMGREGAKYTLRPKTSVPADLADSPGPGQQEQRQGNSCAAVRRMLSAATLTSGPLLCTLL